MDTITAYLSTEIIKALGEGNLPRLMAYVGIFLFLWIEVRGLKKELIKLTTSIESSFKTGEARFERIEHKIAELEHYIVRGTT